MGNPIHPFVALVVVLGLGCSNTHGVLGPTPERQDLEPRLAVLLESWEAMKASGQVCEDLPRLDQPERDCGRIQLELRRLAAEFPNEPSALMANAVVSYDVGYPTRAQAYLDAALAQRPGHPEAARLRSRIASEEGNLAFARRLSGTRSSSPRTTRASARRSLRSPTWAATWSLPAASCSPPSGWAPPPGAWPTTAAWWRRRRTTEPPQRPTTAAPWSSAPTTPAPAPVSPCRSGAETLRSGG